MNCVTTELPREIEQGVANDNNTAVGINPTRLTLGYEP